MFIMEHLAIFPDTVWMELIALNNKLYATPFTFVFQMLIHK